MTNLEFHIFKDKWSYIVLKRKKSINVAEKQKAQTLESTAVRTASSTIAPPNQNKVEVTQIIC